MKYSFAKILTDSKSIVVVAILKSVVIATSLEWKVILTLDPRHYADILTST